MKSNSPAPSAGDSALSCILVVNKDPTKGIKSIVCDTFQVLGSLFGLNGGNFDSLTSKINRAGDENGNWQFQVKFDPAIWP